MERKPIDIGKEVLCTNCGISAEDFFECNGEKTPEYFYLGMTWYCCEQCYDEKTEHE